MQERDRIALSLGSVLSFGIAFIIFLIAAFPSVLAGETRITITEEYKGVIREQKPHVLLDVNPYDTTGGFTPEQQAALADIINSPNLSVERDVIQNAIIVDLYKKGNYAVLLNEAQAYVKKYPEGHPVYRPHILFAIAEAYYYQAEYQEALARYRQLMNNYASSEIYSSAHQGLAWCLTHLGRYAEARVEFKERLRPPTPEGLVVALYGRAINDFNDGRYQDAIQLFLDETGYRNIMVEGIWSPLSKSLVPNNLYFKGLAYDRLGDPKTAASYFRRVAEDYPNHPKAGSATYLVGWLSFLAADYSTAISWFNKSIALVKDSSSLFEIRSNLSQAYFNAGRLGEAISSWRSIREGWGSAVANTGLEQAYTRLVSEDMYDNPVSMDSLECLLKNFAVDLPTSHDLPTFQVDLAQRYYDEKNYDKTLKWAATASGGQASEDIIKQAKRLRLYAFFSQKKWAKLVEEGKNFLAKYSVEDDLMLNLALGFGYAARADDLEKNNKTTEANKLYKEAIPFLEYYMKSVSADDSYRERVEQVLSYCRMRIQ